MIGCVDPIPNDLERGVQSIDDIEFRPGRSLSGEISDSNPGALPGVFWDTKKLFAPGYNSPDNVIQVMLFNNVMAGQPTRAMDLDLSFPEFYPAVLTPVS